MTHIAIFFGGPYDGQMRELPAPISEIVLKQAAMGKLWEPRKESGLAPTVDVVYRCTSGLDGNGELIYEHITNPYHLTSEQSLSDNP